MSYEISINNKTSTIELLNRCDNKVKIALDGKKFDVDIVMIEKGVYSIIMDGISYNIELVENGSCKKYEVNTLYETFDVEIIDAETKYLKSRKKSDDNESNVISTPMPGKVVKIPVKIGDKVKAGDTVIIISAMKMESEYKVKKDRLIKDILVNEGDTVDGHQPLIYIE